PGADFVQLTRDAFGRRTDRMQPDASLILQKALGRVPHEGGQRFAAGSSEYRVLRSWIAEGLNDDGGPPSLRELLDHPDADVRAAAAAALLRTDPDLEAKLPALTPALQHRASVGGKYGSFITRLKIPQHLDQVGAFHDYNQKSEPFADYEGFKDLPA